MSSDAPILYPKGKNKETDAFKSLMKNAMLLEPKPKTAKILESILAQAEPAADAGVPGGRRICAG